MLAAGTIWETSETGENAVVEQIDFLTGLTGLFTFSLSSKSWTSTRLPASRFPLPASRLPPPAHRY
jgi:hypothetical protein